MKPTLEIVLMFISLASFLGGVVMWYTGAITKRYAAQRDFEHLKRSYSQMAENQAKILDELDRRFDAVNQILADIKGLEMALLTKLGSENSTGWYRKPE